MRVRVLYWEQKGLAVLAGFWVILSCLFLFSVCRAEPPSVPLPSLQALQSNPLPTPSRKIDPAELTDLLGMTGTTGIDTSAVMQMRPAAIREAAQLVTLQTAISWRYGQLLAETNRHSDIMDAAFNFTPLLMTHGDALIMPPVLTRGGASMRIEDGNTASASAASYELLESARYVSVVPHWRWYLMADAFPAPEKPNPAVMPTNSEERDIWQAAVREAWTQGVEAADHLFGDNIARMVRDFRGIMLYHLLTAQDLLSSVRTASADMGMNISGNKLNLGQKVYRITSPSTFTVTSLAQPVADAPTPSSAFIPSPSRVFAEPTYRIHTTGTAKAIAKRNRVPANTFCRWNNTTPDMLLHKGRMVYLHEPEVISPPVVTAVAAHPTYPVVAPTPSVVSVAPSANVASGVAAVAPASVAAPTPISVPVSVPAPAVLPVASVSSSLVEPVAPAAGELAPTASETAVEPPAPEPVPETWTIVPGKLHEQLSMWAKQADYQIIWKTRNDFDMESYARFQGDFLNAIRQLFAGLQRSGHALRVTLYQGNKVLEVNDE